MNLIDVFNLFPTQEACIKHLEKVRWGDNISCPYCRFRNHISLNQNRYHCNKCNKSFSVTVNTIFHNTKLPLQKWFLAIALMLNAKKGCSAKQLERNLDLTYKTAWYVGMRIRQGLIDNTISLSGIIEMDETFIGGKPRKTNIKSESFDHRVDRDKRKTPVVGMVERQGKVIAQVQKNLTRKEIHKLIRKKVDYTCPTIVTDEYLGYNRLNKFMNHLKVDPSVGFSIDGINTNTIESFWAILKRGIIGQYHKVSEKFLPLYLAEFCFRYNYRDSDDLFGYAVRKSLNL